MTTFDKEFIAARAREGVIIVKFTKVNGDERVMNCTLHSDHLPPQTNIVEHKTKQNANVLAVWDIDSKGWRSFRIDSVKEVILNKIDSIL